MRPILLAVLVALPLPAIADSAQPPVAPPELYGQIALPTGLMLDGVAFGGISGLDFDPSTGRFLAISDDRAERGPARMYELGLAAEKGRLTLDIIATRLLTGPDGQGFAPKDVDPEAIRLDPASGRVFWASETDAAGMPAVYTAALDGSDARALPLPDAYLPDAAETKGVRGNLSFEGLTLADGNALVLATENALIQDGDKATLEAGSRSRILVLDRNTGMVLGEHLYLTDPIFAEAAVKPFWNDNGITEILSLGGNRFAVMERSFALGVGNRIAVYTVELPAVAPASVDVMPADAQPLAKTLWFKIDEGDFGLDIDNVEAMAFGPEVDGRKTLVIASDNNFNPLQVTQFVMFTLPE